MHVTALVVVMAAGVFLVYLRLGTLGAVSGLTDARVEDVVGTVYKARDWRQSKLIGKWVVVWALLYGILFLLPAALARQVAVAANAGPLSGAASSIFLTLLPLVHGIALGSLGWFAALAAMSFRALVRHRRLQPPREEQEEAGRRLLVVGLAGVLDVGVMGLVLLVH